MSGVPDFSRREQAFRLYAQYRNLSKVSKELKIPTQTLHKWKKDLQWEDKLAQLRDKLRGQVDIIERAKDNLSVAKDIQQLDFIALLEEEVAKAISEKTIVLTSWKDAIATLEYTTKQKRLLLGEVTEREVNSVEVSFTKEEDLDKHIEELQRFITNDKQPK